MRLKRSEGREGGAKILLSVCGDAGRMEGVVTVRGAGGGVGCSQGENGRGRHEGRKTLSEDKNGALEGYIST